jgi:hypothetical protein
LNDTRISWPVTWGWTVTAWKGSTVPTAFSSKGIDRSSTIPTATGIDWAGGASSLAQPSVNVRTESRKRF